jgi:hypothetical protein
MEDVPEDPMMSHIIKDVRRRLGKAESTVEVVRYGISVEGKHSKSNETPAST